MHSPKEAASNLPISPKNQLTSTPKDEGAKDFISLTDQLPNSPKTEATKSSPYQVCRSSATTILLINYHFTKVTMEIFNID
ncbi:hypothetical protein GCK32_016162 [Trichostrongylus colubriformis]|uniref:Uncharacterized protein n=1 Tax=Trichostrongylus colubriformis TaxID=6319 RepID=A0AAN8ILD9_TRICO